MRTELESLVGKEVGVEFTVEKKGRRTGGEVRCIKFTKVMVVEDHKLKVVAEVHHIWIQNVPEFLSVSKEGDVLRGIGTVLEYTKKGGVRDYTVQNLRNLRKVN